MGEWDTSVNILNIPYCNDMKIVGVHFTSSINRSADTNWSIVARQIRTPAKDAYIRNLCMDKRIQYIHNYLLARVWYMVQILPLTEGYRRQIDTATTWYLWKGVTFRVPLSTIQRRKLRCGWNLTNVSTKSRALLYYRLTIQGRETDTFTANWLRKWDLLSLDENPPHITRIPHYLGYLRQYALDNAYIHPQGCGETKKAYKSRIYSTMSHLLNVTVVPPLMRNERLWPNTDWPMVWKNIQATPAPDTLRSQWYNVIHALIPTNERLHKIHLSPTDQCRL
jgi:hypothetical protein